MACHVIHFPSFLLIYTAIFQDRWMSRPSRNAPLEPLLVYSTPPTRFLPVGGARLAEEEGSIPLLGQQRREISRLHSLWRKSHQDMTVGRWAGPLINLSMGGTVEVLLRTEEEGGAMPSQVIITPTHLERCSVRGWHCSVSYIPHASTSIYSDDVMCEVIIWLGA